jgi:hypothetical protein
MTILKQCTTREITTQKLYDYNILTVLLKLSLYTPLSDNELALFEIFTPIWGFLAAIINNSKVFAKLILLD